MGKRQNTIADVRFTGGKKTVSSFSAKASGGVLYSRVLKNGESIKTDSGKFYRLNEDSIEMIRDVLMDEDVNFRVSLKGEEINAHISEVWMVANAKNDKANAVGLDVGKGDLIMGITSLKDKAVIEKISKLGVMYELELNLPFSKVKMR